MNKDTKKIYDRIVTATLLAGTGIALLVHFIQLWRNPEGWTIIERNKVILTFESLGVAAIIGYGVVKFVDVISDILKEKPPNKDGK